MTSAHAEAALDSRFRGNDESKVAGHGTRSFAPLRMTIRMRSSSDKAEGSTSYFLPDPNFPKACRINTNRLCIRNGKGFSTRLNRLTPSNGLTGHAVCRRCSK